MTYVSEQTSAELRQHMRKLVAMKGWHDPLADRLWKEVQTLDQQNSELIARIRELEGDTGKSADAWQPIETAPENVSVLWRGGCAGDRAVGRWEKQALRMSGRTWPTWWGGGWVNDLEEDPSTWPTHWKPLDAPSAGRAAPEGGKEGEQ